MSIYDTKTYSLKGYVEEKMPDVLKDIKRPVIKVKDGTVSIAKWENKTKDGKSFYNYTIDVSYFDDAAKEWKKTNSLNKTQLSDLRICIDKVLDLTCDIQD